MIAASGQNYQLCIFTGFILKLYNVDNGHVDPSPEIYPTQWFLDAISTTGKVVLESNMEDFLESFNTPVTIFSHSQIFSENFQELRYMCQEPGYHY